MPRIASPNLHLVRGIRKWDGVALVLNSIVGAGIFGLPSRVFALAGAYSLLAYVVCAVPIFLMILCFAEVSSRFSSSGGPYLYARETFGRLVGFEVGWLTWISRLTAFAALCNLCIDYLSYFVPAASGGLARAVAITAVVVALAGLNIIGVRRALVVGNVLTFGKIVPLAVLAGVGFLFVNRENYSFSQAPPYSAFSSSVLLLAFAFMGFETATIPAGETMDPRRNLPFALLTGTVIVLVLYVAVQAVCIGTLKELAMSQRPLADVAGQLWGGTGAAIIALVAIVSVTGTMNAVMLATPRLLFAMAEQRQVPSLLAATHRRFHTPHVAITISAAGMLLLTLGGTFASAAMLSTIIRLATYAVTCVALPVLRRRSGSPPATFTAPYGDVVSVAAVALIIWLMSSSSGLDTRSVIVAVTAGLVLYVIFAEQRRRAERLQPAIEPLGPR